MWPAAALQRMSEAGEAARFYRALATTFSSGLPLSQGLELLSTAENEPSVRSRAARLRAALSRGATLGEASAGAPFLELEQALLQLGEESGTLVSSMESLARFFEADHRLALSLKARAVRPLITLFAACFILPVPVLVRSGLSAYLALVAPALTLGLLSLGTLLWAIFSFLRGRPRYAYARMLWALATALDAGLPIERAVRLAAAALGPGPLAARLAAMPAARWQGRPLSQTLPEVWPLPRLTVSTLATMERTGDTRILHWLAKSYEDGAFTVR